VMGSNSNGEGAQSGSGWGHGGGNLVLEMSCGRGGESFYRVGRRDEASGGQQPAAECTFNGCRWWVCNKVVGFVGMKGNWERKTVGAEPRRQ
jgi:hypothetical protein